MELNQFDKSIISSISSNYNLDYALIEKLYVEMIKKARNQILINENLKKLAEKIKAKTK